MSSDSTHPLRLWRLRHQLTQADLAKATGVSEPTIWRVEERGGHVPTAEVLWRLIEGGNQLIGDSTDRIEPEMIVADCPFCRRAMALPRKRKTVAA